jgi:regulator of sirC expression with transglutaminase-like and TPR domain
MPGPHDDRDAARVRFRELTRRADTDLAASTLEIARIGHPGLDPAHSLQVLDELAAACRPQVEAATSIEARVVVLNRFLFQECGFHGNQEAYYDPRNSFLNDVLQRRTGIPITLSVVLIEVARRVDIAMQGVGFPGHFLVRVPVDGGVLILDPFFGGRPLGEPELLERLRPLHPQRDSPTRLPPALLAPLDPRDLLARMLRNLMHIFREQETDLQALHAVDLLLVLDPDSPDDLLARATLFERLECGPAAIADYRRCLDLAPAGRSAEPVRRRLARLLRSVPPLH